jgi:hypothetical protein
MLTVKPSFFKNRKAARPMVQGRPRNGKNSMPEGLEHKDFCQRWNKQLHQCRSGCPLGLYRQWDMKPDSAWCPLDGLRRADGRRWKGFHAVKRVLGYSEVERPLQVSGRMAWPQINGCVAWVQRALDKLEPHLDEFYSQFTDVSREDVRWCWTAHLVADFACDYCYVATGLKGKYRHIKSGDPHFWALFCNYVTDVRNRIVSAAN